MGLKLISSADVSGTHTEDNIKNLAVPLGSDTWYFEQKI